MIATIIGKNIIYKEKLPNKTVGTYWIEDENKKKILSIEGTEEGWEIRSSSQAKILKSEKIKSRNVEKMAKDKNNIIEKILLKQYDIQYIYLKDYSNDFFLLFAYPDFEEDYIHLERNSSSKITIGSSKENDIIYENPLIQEKHASIFFSNGKLMLENYDELFGTFVNNNAVSQRRKMLFNGDVIFILGLKIIILGKKIYINNPLGKVQYNSKIFKEIEENEEFQYDIADIENTDDEDIDVYSEKDYFARAPKIYNVIEHKKIKIDAPPASQDKEGMPLSMILVSSLTMGMVSIITMGSTISRLASGEAKLKDSIFSLAMSGALLLSMIALPLINVRYEKKRKKKEEKNRQERYRKYINSKSELIDNIKKEQKEILYENYISAEECARIILNKGQRLWERKINDDSFLNVRVGIGDIPIDAEFEYPKNEFSLEDDNLVEILNTIVNKSEIIKNVPITYSMVEKKVSALIVKDNYRLIEKFVQNVIMQLITLHSYKDLKLVFFLKKETEKKWKHLNVLPHVWDNTNQIRFWASDFDDMQELSRRLEEQLNNRKNIAGQNDYKSFEPYYLIITDDYKKVKNLKIISDILDCNRNMGYSIFCISDNLVDLPNECEKFIELDENQGIMYDNINSLTNRNEFIFDTSYTFFFEKIGTELANIPMKQTVTSTLALPSSYSFLEMYDVGKIEQLNILKRWKYNDSTVSLRAPIGVDANGMTIYLDIHEKAHGPHGLIAGSTGSGKSEFIITYILSLAVNYHPDDVTMILIDYKGGGLAGAFKKNEIVLPHLVGTITNLDTAELQRTLASIRSELKRRQVIFNKAKNSIDEGTMDIYKYQKLYHQGVTKEAVPHLLIICDEFAELKQQQEEFMEELISVARIGRSLGVHLILATQKPAGVVNDQIRSNSKFGICLKVQDSEDSMDVIKKPDAVNLRNAGQFYMNVGNEEYFILGQSAWAGAQYIPSDSIKKTIDDSIKFVSNIGRIEQEVNTEKNKDLNLKGEQLTNVVKYLYELAKDEGIHERQLWMENIPEKIYVNDIREKYNICEEKNVIKPVIGEYDDPYNQRQGPVHINFTEGGNTIIYGNAESGKETLLSTLVYDVITHYTTEEVQMYILDFGSEVLKKFKDSDYVGDVIISSEEEKIVRLFSIIEKEIKERTKILAEFGGEYNLYVNSNNTMPMKIVIINNYELFAELFEFKYDDILLTLTREGVKYGIVFIFVCSNYNDVRYRLAQNFRQKIVLQLNNENDYSSIFEGIGRKKPAQLFGRGLVQFEDIYEFQTAKICEPQEWNERIKEAIEITNQNNTIKAQSVPELPSMVTIENVKDEIEDWKAIPIGIEKKNLTVGTYNFEENFINIIAAKNIMNVSDFIAYFIKEVQLLKKGFVHLFDAERLIQTDVENLNLNFNNLALEIMNNIRENQQVICIIIGIDKFIKEIDDNENAFFRLLQSAENLKNYRFIIIDQYSKIKKREFEDWYREYISNDRGIWLGNGINDQYLLNINSSRERLINNCGSCFGYLIRDENATLVKLLGMKEEEENE